MTSKKNPRPVFLGAFPLNERSNVILNKDTCERLGVGYERPLALYLTPGGQLIGKVVENRYRKATVLEWDGGQRRERLVDTPDYEWLSDWDVGNSKAYMPRGFLAPEDTRW